VDIGDVMTRKKKSASGQARIAKPDKLDQRDDLIEQVLRGKMKPEEAEAQVFAGHALYLHGNEELVEADPFTVVIAITSNHKMVDLKTRSKWSRALRYAVASKSGEESLRDFMQWKGGINACADRFERRGRRWRSTH
jgi:hypothetical protein